ncbi:MAG: aminopeptidase P family protein [Pelotomaculum sp.]|nr:aminopeptidase P family protein [Pelotomaculum sp.]
MLKRVEKLRELLEGAGVEAFYITSPENRFYLSGFTGTAGAVLVTREGLWLLTDFRYTGQARRECPGFEIVEVAGSYPEAVLEISRGKGGFSLLGCEGDHLTYSQFMALKEGLAGVGLKPLGGLVEKLRICKDESEINLIEQAVLFADEAFKRTLPYIRPGVTEREVALQLEYIMRRMGADASAFKIIVASGSRSALPHGVASAKTIQAGDLVTIDFGAVYGGYHSDLTRTVAVGRPDKKQEEIYSIVLEAQKKAIAALRAGVRALEVDYAARQTIRSRGYGSYFGHGTGHGLGLSIHEGPRLSERDGTVLQTGMVVTVEPGIYLPGWGGVRIEDTVVVEDGGCRVLTRSPKDELIVLL